MKWKERSKEWKRERAKADLSILREAHACEAVPDRQIMHAAAKPAGCSDTRWRMEQARRRKERECGSWADFLFDL